MERSQSTDHLLILAAQLTDSDVNLKRDRDFVQQSTSRHKMVQRYIFH